MGWFDLIKKDLIWKHVIWFGFDLNLTTVSWFDVTTKITSFRKLAGGVNRSPHIAVQGRVQFAEHILFITQSAGPDLESLVVESSVLVNIGGSKIWTKTDLWLWGVIFFIWFEICPSLTSINSWEMTNAQWYSHIHEAFPDLHAMEWFDTVTLIVGSQLWEHALKREIDWNKILSIRFNVKRV